MKKIIVFLTAMFMFAGLFGQGKIVIDEKAAFEIEKLKSALKSVGVEYELGAFIPESDENGVEDALTVDEFVENLESMSVLSSTYINALQLIPIYQKIFVGGQWIFYWNGNVASRPDIVGNDWYGVKHTRETSSGTVVETQYVQKPSYSYQWQNVPYSTPKLCAQLYDHQMVYFPGLGWVPVIAPFGNKACGTVNFNW